jgi:hypothetical protein
MPGEDEKVLAAPCNLANMRTTGKQPQRSRPLWLLLLLLPQPLQRPVAAEQK